MKIITSFEIAARSENDLKALFGNLSKKLVTTKAGTAERRNTLASMENVQREISFVHAQGLKM